MSPSPLRTSRRSVADWCTALARQLPGRWYTLPYNRYQSEETDWWISSVSDNPAYAAAKVSCRRVGGQLKVGLLFEKGMSEKLRSIHPRKSEVMTPRWAWSRALTHVAGAEFDGTLHALATLGPVELQVAAGAVGGNVSDWRSVYYAWDGAEFAREAPGERRLSHMPETLLLSELPGLLEAVPDADWTWIDVYFQLPVTFDPEAPLDAEAVLVREVVDPLATIARRLTGSSA